VVFEFTSPLTPYGSSTSGHAGSGDRYLFPEYSILEYQAGGTILIASFLLVRKVDPNTKFPLESSSDIPPKSKSKASKSKKKDKEKEKLEAGGSSTPAPEKAAQKDQDNKEPGTAGKDAQPADGKPAEGDAAKEDNTKKNESNLKEYYQPLTMRFYSSKPATLEPLSRIVKPLAEVQKYMEEVMDRAERAPTGFLAFHLPREAKTNVEESASVAPEELKPKTTQTTGTTPGAVSEVEETDNMANETEFDELEDELKEFYDPPSGLVPLPA
jgi:hypothetical protein